MLNLSRQQALTFLKLQCLTALLVAVAFLLVSFQQMIGALVGGVICVLANSFFVYKAFRVSGARQAKGIMGGFISGEIGKITITVMLMIGVFLYTTLPTLPVFIGFLLTQSVFWIAPFVFKRPQVSKT